MIVFLILVLNTSFGKVRFVLEYHERFIERLNELEYRVFKDELRILGAVRFDNIISAA